MKGEWTFRREEVPLSGFDIVVIATLVVLSISLFFRRSDYQAAGMKIDPWLDVFQGKTPESQVSTVS